MHVISLWNVLEAYKHNCGIKLNEMFILGKQKPEAKIYATFYKCVLVLNVTNAGAELSSRNSRYFPESGM